MQALAGKGLHGLPQDEEELKKLTPAEREELILKIRTSLQVKMYLFSTARCFGLHDEFDMCFAEESRKDRDK